jgi:hypothetical protein
MVEAPPAPGGPAASPHPSPDRGSRRGFTIPRVLAVAVALGIAILWIWAFAVGNQTPPGRLDDRGFTERAEEVCREAGDEVAALPQAYETTSAAERADVVERSNAVYSTMVAELRTMAPTGGDDVGMVTGWLGDWERYIADRADYAARLRTDESARFYVTDKDGDQVTEPVDTLANVNGMGSCATPSDLS